MISTSFESSFFVKFTASYNFSIQWLWDYSVSFSVLKTNLIWNIQGLLDHQSVFECLWSTKGPSNRVLKKKIFLPFRVPGALRAEEYAGKNRFSKYWLFHNPNRPWSLVVKTFQTRLPPGKILDRGRKYSHWKACGRFSWKKYQENVCIAYESRKHIMVHVKWLWVMTELQTRFGIWKRQYFEKRFLPAYSTALRAPDTRKGKTFLFFQNYWTVPYRKLVAWNLSTLVTL